MKNGWTGGQYSLIRALLGVALIAHFPMQPQGVIGIVASIAFAIGFQSRIAALVACAALSYPLHFDPLQPMLLLYALVPSKPYGSVDARGRVDPRGGWAIAPWLYALAWIVAIGAWVAAIVLHAPISVAFVVANLILFNPFWVPAKRTGEAPVPPLDYVFYDGSCGLCHRATRFLISEDLPGTSFRYAPLGGDAFNEMTGAASGLPDSMVVRPPSGALLTKSAAALYVAKRLGGIWRLLGALGTLVPRVVRDAVYDFIARIRYRLFARPKEACPMLPPDLRKRFSA